MNKQVTYAGMIWLFVAQLVVMLPFTFDLPLWLIAVVFFSASWRLRALAGGRSQPGNLVKITLVALGVIGLWLSGLRFPSMEAMSALLLLGFAFKSLEVVERRDAVVVVFIGYFLVALHFLYSQSILAGAYGAFALMMLTGALIGVQQSVVELSSAQQVRFNLRLAGLMLLQCLPLMIMIFVFAPRLPPFWSLPIMMDQTKTGISDRMAPGDIEKLGQSDELAFRVSFKGTRPPQGELYWRGLVLNYFDGHEWRQLPSEEQQLPGARFALDQDYEFQPGNLLIGGDPVEYEAMYEKTGQPWLFTLTPSVHLQGEVMRAADYRVMARQELQAPFLLKATSYPQAVLDVTLAEGIRELALQLPPHGDPRSRALAQQLRTEAGSDEAYIERVLQRFRQQPFYYTLHPQLLGDKNTIDAFLFDTQSGFCSHYAGSFVFLMRAVGIPARVVIGYQGGEWNNSGSYLSVRQYDAHAWTEIWLPEKGWQRFDPTSMVAPERTEQGLEAAVKKEGSFLENQLLSTRQIAWMNTLHQKLDALQYGWQRWVLSYDGDTQANLLKSILGDVGVRQLAILVGGLLASILLLWLVVLGLTRRGQKEAAEHRLYRTFCAHLAKRGVERLPGQAPGAFAVQAAAAFPEQAEVIKAFTRAYETLCYVPEEAVGKAVQVQALKRLLRELSV